MGEARTTQYGGLKKPNFEFEVTIVRKNCDW